VDLPDGVVDVDERQPVGAGQQPRHRRRQPGQHSGVDGVELADVPKGERAQERAQRRRRPDTGEDPVHPAVTQNVEVVDAVGAGQHPGNHTRRLRRRVRRPHAQLPAQQAMQPRQLRQPHHRHQTRRPDQIWVIENRRNPRYCMHLTDAPSELVD
jgi:hypothetical protein